MTTHKFTLTIEGTENEATQKANAVATLATLLDHQTLSALARVVQNDPKKVALAKKFLGL
jgi:hypothetical protein